MAAARSSLEKPWLLLAMLLVETREGNVVVGCEGEAPTASSLSMASSSGARRSMTPGEPIAVRRHNKCSGHGGQFL